MAESDDARLASLGYQPQLRRVLGLFANFSVHDELEPTGAERALT
jgi:hypothetical protein